MVSDSLLNPQVDLSNTTSNAFIKIDNIKNKSVNPLLGKEEKYNSPINKVRVKVYTPFDDKTHTYFHSMSIDKDIADFMGTAELRCPYDSDLMEYWEPARAYCVIYGTNRGDYKILFIGRVREVNQQGYEIVIALQDYGWKFKQLITQSYANDNVIGKDGYTIMKLIFQALKIDSWVITPTAKFRLKQVGVDEDGNITLNKKEIEEMPNLINRLKTSNPKWSINKYTVYNKMKESELHNVDNINYTLRYEKPTKIMKKTAKGSDYAKGKDIYGTNYGSGGGSGSSGGSGGSNKASKKTSASGHPRPPSSLCNNVKSTTICSALKLVWAFNRGYSNELTSARTALTNYAATYPAAYRAQARPVLATMSKYCIRSDKRNGAAIILSAADSIASKASSPGQRGTTKLATTIAADKRKNKSAYNNNFGAFWNFFTRKRG